MGFFKRFLEEQDASGFRTARHFDSACEHCIGDEALSLFVSRHTVVSSCDFCGREQVHGISVGDLCVYMAACIAEEWDDPLNEVGWDRGWDPGMRIYDSDDLLGILDEPLSNDELRETFVDAFDHEWCQRDPYRLEHWHMLKLSWDLFAHLVRTRHRYLFLMIGDNGADGELVAPAQMLAALAQAIHNAPERLLRRVPAGTALFRARAHSPALHPTSAAELGSPQPRQTHPNRMSPAGVSMFYATEDPDLAAGEVRAGPDEVITVGRWTTTRDIWCLDLTNAEPIPSLFDMTGRRSRPWLRFLAHFAADLSKPASEEAPDVDYVPTQVVTEYVRDILRSTTTGEPIEAIAYRSAIDATRTCWVVFAGPEHCGNAAGPAGRLLTLDFVDARENWIDGRRANI